MSDQSTPTSAAHQEEWRPVVGYEGYYSVSSLGRVRRDRAGKGARVGHILSATINSGNGYLRVGLVVNGRQLTLLVHRLVAEAFIGLRPSSMTVNHIDGNKTNNLPANLEYLSLSDNTRHQWENGHATEHGSSPKLTEDKVREIRALVASGLSRSVVGSRFGISRQSVNDIVWRKTWAGIL